MSDDSNKQVDRRSFVSTTAATAGLLILKPELVRGTAANSAVRLGLLGCGGRGTEVSTSFATNTAARVVALADLFEDQLEKGKKHFDEFAAKKGYAGIDRKLMFQGSKAFEQLAASKEVDVIGKYVRSVHAKDGLFPTEPRKLGAEVPIGHGRVDFPRVITELRNLGYHGAITIERETSGPRQIEDIKQSRAFLEGIIRGSGSRSR